MPTLGSALPSTAATAKDHLRGLVLEDYLTSTTAPPVQKLWALGHEDFRIKYHKVQASEAIAKFDKAWTSSA